MRITCKIPSAMLSNQQCGYRSHELVLAPFSRLQQCYLLRRGGEMAPDDVPRQGAICPICVLWAQLRM